MADILISMNKVTDKLWKYADEWEKTPEHFDGVNPFCVAIHAVRQKTNAPELLKEQKHGHWKRVEEGFTDMMCSECGELALLDLDRDFVLSKYCPNCGARMDGEVEQE